MVPPFLFRILTSSNYRNNGTIGFNPKNNFDIQRYVYHLSRLFIRCFWNDHSGKICKKDCSFKFYRFQLLRTKAGKISDFGYLFKNQTSTLCRPDIGVFGIFLLFGKCDGRSSFSLLVSVLAFWDLF